MSNSSPLGGDFTSGAWSIGSSAATGNFLGAAIGAAGLGMSLFGGNKAKQAAEQESADQSQLGAEERQMLSLQNQQTTLDFQRQQRSLIRNSLQTRADSRAAAVASGSQLGSGFKGGQGQIGGQTANTSRNLGQNYQLSEQEFGVAESEVSTAQAIGQDQSNISQGQATQNLGSTLTANMGAIGRIGGFLGGFLQPGGGASAA